MNKRYAFLMMAVLFPMITLAAGLTQPWAVNSVGFQAVNIPRGERTMVSMPFASLWRTAVKSADVFENQLPDGTCIYAFDPASGTYVTDTKSADGWSTNIVYRQSLGIWIKIPDNAPRPSYRFVFSGQVPTDTTVTNTVYPALNMMAYPFACNVAWTNTALAVNAIEGDKLYLWNGSAYETYTRTAGDWGAATNVSLRMGIGFMYYSARTGVTTCVERRPYPTFSDR